MTFKKHFLDKIKENLNSKLNSNCVELETTKIPIFSDLCNETNGCIRHSWADYLTDELFFGSYAKAQREGSDKYKSKNRHFSTSYYFSNITSHTKYIIYNKSDFTDFSYKDGINIIDISKNNIKKELKEKERYFTDKNTDLDEKIDNLDLCDYSMFLKLYIDFENTKEHLNNLKKEIKSDSVLNQIIEEIEQKWRKNELKDWNTINVQTNISWADPLSNVSHGTIVVLSEKPIEEDILNQIQWLTYPIILKISEIEYMLQTIRKDMLIMHNQLKTAITSVLIDSFAHNVSAHSLAAIKWWFEIRAKFIYNKRISMEDTTGGTTKAAIKSLECFFPGKIDGDASHIKLEKIAEQHQKHLEILGLQESTDSTSLLEVIQYISPDLEKELFTYRAFSGDDKKPEDVFRYPVPVDHALWHFMRFMRDKASFWSGVTRDMPFGGESKNLYEVLWNDFAENPLYLGTIAQSEGILKINIHIDLPNVDGTEFAKIDMSVIEWEKEISGLKEPGQETKEEIKEEKIEYSRYAFVRVGKNHSVIREELQKNKYNMFFPGGIVGEHAFFTLLENTLRNVKHLKESEEWAKIEKDGLNLRIKIKPSKLMEMNKNVGADEKHELFRIEVLLDHNIDLYKQIKKIDGTPTEIKIKKLLVEQTRKPVVNMETGGPRLGGNAQDKICAAMLLNNTFISVEKGLKPEASERDEYYCDDNDFNWIGFDEVPAKSYREIGKIKKYFHLWKSEFIYPVNSVEDFKEENLSRFKFIYIKENTMDNQDKIIETARKNGVIRILTYEDIKEGIKLEKNKIENMDEETMKQVYKQVYKTWLDKFLFKRKAIIMGEQTIPTDKREDKKDFLSNDCPGAPKICDNTITEVSENDIDKIIHESWDHLDFSHGVNTCPSEILDFRSHGALIKHFLDRERVFNVCNFKNHQEFIEILFAKICIYDDRLYERVFAEKLWLYENKLYLIFNKEIEAADDLPHGYDWETFNRKEIGYVNILIMHLSFIEKLGYEEHRINEFIESINFVDNEKFILVITTGRGRYSWRDSLNKKNARFTIFKPIESLLSAVEEAATLKDDFQIKYNLIKVIFGS